MEEGTESETIIASPITVTDYLVKEYEITTDDATALCIQHIDIINKDAEMRSYAYWPGDKIARLAELTPREELDLDE